MRKLNSVKPLILSAVFVMLVAGLPNFLHASEEVFGFSSESGGTADSYLGVDTRDVTPDRLNALQLKEEKGVEVTMVDQDAPAGKAGLKEHDVILSVNGTNVESVEQLRRIIHEIPAGRIISIGLSRNGQPITVKAQLTVRNRTMVAAWPQSGEFKFNMPVMPVIPQIPDIDLPAFVVAVHSFPRSGLMVETLTPQLADFFGVKSGEGILVRSVEKGSRAEKAGFRAGDVIVKVNGEKINDSGDFTHAVNCQKEGTATVTVVREKKPMNLTLTLPEHGPSGEMMHETANDPLHDARAAMEAMRDQGELARLQTRIQPEVARHADELQRLKSELQAHPADLERIKPEIERATKSAQEELHKELETLQRDHKDQQLVIRKLIENSFSGRGDI